MGDREARALGVGVPIEVNGKQYEVQPLSLKALAILQREALQSYKKQYIETYAQNLDVLGERGLSILEKKLEEAARWDLKDLPKKRTFSASHVPITSDLIARLVEVFQQDAANDNGWRAILVTVLDRELISPDEVKALTGVFPIQALADYDQWWSTATVEGVTSMVYASVSKANPEVTKDEIGAWDLVSLLETAKLVENLTVPAVGNISSPSPQKKSKRKPNR